MRQVIPLVWGAMRTEWAGKESLRAKVFRPEQSSHLPIKMNRARGLFSGSKQTL